MAAIRELRPRTGSSKTGRAAYAFARQRGIEPQDIVLVGNSLGSGVATHLAGEVEAAALVLISPFDSLEATAARPHALPPRAPAAARSL